MYISTKDMLKDDIVSVSDLKEIMSRKLIRNIFINFYGGDKKKFDTIEELIAYHQSTELEEINKYKEVTIAIVKRYTNKCREIYDEYMGRYQFDPHFKGSAEDTLRYWREEICKQIKILNKWEGPDSKCGQWRKETNKYLKRVKEIGDSNLMFREAVNSYVSLYRIEFEDAAKKLVMERLKAK